MIFIWGTKAVAETLGCAADVCPVCRTVRAMDVRRTGTVGHVFFFPLGTPNLTATVAECTWCEGRFNVDPTRYSSIEKKSDWDLRLLIGKTNPSLADLAGRTFADEAKPRAEAIRAALLRTNSALESRAGRQDRATLIGLVSILAAPILWGILASALPVEETTRKSLVGLSVLIFIAALIVARVVARREPNRFFKRRLLPLLIDELTPLQPTLAELTDSLAQLRKSQLLSGAVLNARSISRALSAGTGGGAES